MKPMKFLLLTGLAAACSSLPSSGDGIVALELRVPRNLSITPPETIQLMARALNQDGDSVEAQIRWYTVDTLVISVDSVSGVVAPIAETGVGRVQASVGALRSDPVSITVKAPTTP